MELYDIYISGIYATELSYHLRFWSDIMVAVKQAFIHPITKEPIVKRRKKIARKKHAERKAMDGPDDAKMTGIRYDGSP